MLAREDKKVTILIVDDEEDIAKIIEFSANKIGFATHIETDPTKAQSYLLKNKPDVLLTDLRMPKVDGLSLIEGIIKDHGDIKVIVITGDGKKEDAVNALRLGVYDFLDKPLSMPRLESILGNVLKLVILEKEKNELLNKIIKKTAT